MRRLTCAVVLFAGLCVGVFPTTSFSQSVANDIDVLDVTDRSSGFNARFRYTLSPDDVARDQVRDWRIEIVPRHSSGRRTEVTEDSGRASTYRYDDLYRPIGEAITDPQNGNRQASLRQ